MEELYDILEKAAKVNGIKLDHLESLKGLLAMHHGPQQPRIQIEVLGYSLIC